MQVSRSWSYYELEQHEGRPANPAHPWPLVQELAERLVFKSEEVSNFSLLANPNRVLVLEGPVDKKGPCP